MGRKSNKGGRQHETFLLNPGEQPDGQHEVEQFDGTIKYYGFKWVKDSLKEGPWKHILNQIPDCERCQNSSTLPIAACSADGRWNFFAGACSCERGAMKRSFFPKLVWHDRATLGLWGLTAQDIQLVHNGLRPGRNYADALDGIPITSEDIARLLKGTGRLSPPKFSPAEERVMAQRVVRIAAAVGEMLQRVEHRDSQDKVNTEQLAF